MNTVPSNLVVELDSAAMAVHSDNSEFSSETKKNEGRHYDQSYCHFNSNKKRPHCTHCGQLGHWFQTWYELHGYPVGYPKGRNNPGPSKHNNNKVVVNYASDMQPLISLLNDQLTLLLSLTKTQDEVSSLRANAITKPDLSKIISRNWIIDSRETNHITSSFKLLHKDENHS